MTDIPKIKLKVSNYGLKYMEKFSTGEYYIKYPSRHATLIFRVHTPELFLVAVTNILADIKLYHYPWKEPIKLEMTPEIEAVGEQFPDIIKKIEESQKEYKEWYEHQQIALYFDEYDPVALFWYLGDTFGVQVEEFDN